MKLSYFIFIAIKYHEISTYLRNNEKEKYLLLIFGEIFWWPQELVTAHIDLCTSCFSKSKLLSMGIDNAKLRRLVQQLLFKNQIAIDRKNIFNFSFMVLCIGGGGGQWDYTFLFSLFLNGHFLIICLKKKDVWSFFS